MERMSVAASTPVLEPAPALPATPGAVAETPHVVVDDAFLTVTHRPGTSGIAVISFSGIGMGQRNAGRERSGGREQKAEFAGTLARAGARDHTQIYIMDRKRSWMNAIAGRLVPLLRQLTAKERAVITLGNSMGGFSAIWVAGQLPNCIRAIATAPQFSINPAHAPQETRWQKYRSAIEVHLVGHAFDHASPSVEYWAFFGREKEADLLHADLFRRHGQESLRLFTLEGAGHNVARLMKRSGALMPVMRLLLQERPVVPGEVTERLSASGLTATTARPRGGPEGPALHQDRREARRQERREARRRERQKQREAAG